VKITLNVWRQSGPEAKGGFEKHVVQVIPEMSFLEMLDVLNEQLLGEGKEPVAFDHDCREGICGTCGAVVNGRPHGPGDKVTLCQVHMRSFKDGDELWIEPFRAKAFPIVKDLVVDRSSFDRIIQAGGYVDVRTGAAQDANATPIPKPVADEAFDYAACIGCGACVAACPNAASMLFMGAKAAHLGILPQGQAERSQRALNMLAQADAEGFGSCTNHSVCTSGCPKGIPMKAIARLNSDVFAAAITEKGTE
jgi:succinate dehydrogenase / fumarate reductase iron-sulfur subunit